MSFNPLSITFKKTMTTLLMVPLKQELNHLINVFVSVGWECQKTQRQGFWFWHFPGQSLVLAIGGYGQSQFETRARFCIRHLGNIRRVFCLGSAGALQQGLKPKDLVCATQVIQYNRHQNSFSNPVVYEASRDVIEVLEMKAKNHSLYFGPIVSVDDEVADDDSKTRIYRDTGGMAVAWEGPGGGRAAKFYGLPFTEIRTITDEAGEDVHLEFQENLQGAMEKLGELVVDFLH